MSTEYLVPHSQEPYTIVYQDEHLLLVNKPHLLLSVPGKHPLNKECLISRLQDHFPSAKVVHRLDLDTSGIMVIALSAPCHAALSRQFRLRQVAKSYIAVIRGHIEPRQGVIDLPIAADWDNRPRQKICHETGKPSVTRYRTLDQGPDTSRLLLHPLTGRSHQLRLHLQALGHPILGCDLYADPDTLARSDRLLLHALRLGFRHPETGRWISEESPCPF